jgi:UDP:flavonoid glycosyltransferase YjiC (YdhE family)
MSKTNRFLPGLLKALAAESLATLAYLPGLDRAEQEKLSFEGMTLTNRPVSINWVTRTCRFAITEGGHNSGAQLLLARIPLLICPRYLEQMLWSYRLVARELCVGISLWSRNPDLRARIRQVQSFTPRNLTG